jgi:molybdate transport system substrate-binding protein
VIWVPKESKLDVTSGVRVLLDSRVRKIAIANPEHAPYGRAAVSAMKAAGVFDKVSDKLVRGENISQAASFVASGNADVGILALSLALAPSMKEKGRYAKIPPADYPPIEQASILLKASTRKEVARQFLAFLKRPEIVQLMQTYGFVIPEGLAKK